MSMLCLNVVLIIKTPVVFYLPFAIIVLLLIILCGKKL